MSGLPKRTANTPQPCDVTLQPRAARNSGEFQLPWGCHKPVASSFWATDLQRHQWSVSRTPCHLGILT